MLSNSLRILLPACAMEYRLKTNKSMKIQHSILQNFNKL